MPTKDLQGPTKLATGRVVSEFMTTGGTNPPSYDSSTTTSQYPSLDRKSRTWTNTPGFRSLRSQGLAIPPQPFQFSSATSDGTLLCDTGWQLGSSTPADGFGYARTVRTVPIEQFRESMLPRPLQECSFSDAVLKLRGKMQDDRTWNSSLFVVEMHKSYDLIVNAAQRVVQALRLVRKRDIAGLQQMFPESLKLTKDKYRRARSRGSDSNSSLWLEYQYGWMPLLYDAHDAAQTLAEIPNTYLSVNSMRKLKASVQGSSVRKFTGVWGDGSIFVNYSGQLLTTDQVRAEVEFYVSDPTAYTLASMGLVNPGSLAWELLPFSFVADWFLPIGSYIETLDAGIGCTVTKFTQSRKSTTLFSMEEATSPLFRSVDGSVTLTSLDVERQVLPDLPAVVPTTLSIRPKLGASRLTSAAALMRELTRSKINRNTLRV